MEKELLQYIVKEIVDQPDQVEINLIEGEKTTICELKVSPDDLGKVIGKRGRIAQALRTILNSCAMKNGKHLTLEILD